MMHPGNMLKTSPMWGGGFGFALIRSMLSFKDADPFFFLLVAT